MTVEQLQIAVLIAAIALIVFAFILRPRLLRRRKAELEVAMNGFFTEVQTIRIEDAWGELWFKPFAERFIEISGRYGMRYDTAEWEFFLLKLLDQSDLTALFETEAERTAAVNIIGVALARCITSTERVEYGYAAGINTLIAIATLEAHYGSAVPAHELNRAMTSQHLEFEKRYAAADTLERRELLGDYRKALSIVVQRAQRNYMVSEIEKYFDTR